MGEGGDNSKQHLRRQRVDSISSEIRSNLTSKSIQYITKAAYITIFNNNRTMTTNFSK